MSATEPGLVPGYHGEPAWQKTAHGRVAPIRVNEMWRDYTAVEKADGCSLGQWGVCDP